MTVANDSTMSVRIRVVGRVQGVCYRDWMVRRAHLNGLSGWVRNRSNGTVESVIAGPRAAVMAMIEDAHSGPPAARVDELTVASESYSGTGFTRRPTL